MTDAQRERTTRGDGVDQAAVQRLAARLRGKVLRPGDTNYDAARLVFNAMIDRRPALLVRCAEAADMVAGVAFTQEHSIPLSVRGGGHSVAGTAVCEGGLMLDLSQ